MVHAISDAADLVVHLVAFEQPSHRATPSGEIGGKLAQVERNLVGIVVKRLVINKLTGRASAALDLLCEFFRVANRRVQIVVERLVIEQASDGALSCTHILHNFVKVIGELAESLSQVGSRRSEVAHRAARGRGQQRVFLNGLTDRSARRDVDDHLAAENTRRRLLRS